MKPKSVFLCIGILLLTDIITAVEFHVFGTLGSIKEFACHERAILQCTVSPLTDPVFWQIGKPVIPSTDIAAECSGHTCLINPAVSGTYDFSYDENTGVSNLTIFNVTLSENETQYKCDDGSSPPPAPFVGIVQDALDIETTHISKTLGQTNVTNITVKTGCVSRSLIDNISFQWFIIKENESVLEIYPANTTTNWNETLCLTMPVCVTNGSAQISDTFSIEEDNKSPSVFFQVQVMLNGRMLYAVNSSSLFRPKTPVLLISPPVPDICWIIIVIILCAARVLFLQAWISAYCLCKTYQDDKCIRFLAISLGIFFPGLGILLIGLKIVRDGWKDKMLICGLIILAFFFVVIEIMLLLLCFALDVDYVYLYVIGVFYLLFIDVCDGCITFYVVFKSDFAGKDSESFVCERHPLETNTKISNQPPGTNERYTCGCCKKISSIKNYCMECHEFLCDSCNAQHKCDGIRLRHLQHEGSKREAEFRCDKNHKKKKQTIAAHGYCLTCSMYLCTECLIQHHKDQDNLLWIPHNDGMSNDGLCCYRGHTDRKDTTDLGYCKQCNIYVCTQCTDRHKEHNSLVIHHEQGGDFENCKKCKSLAECFHLNNRICLCSDCYECGDFSVRGSALDEKLSEIIKKQQKCMLHDVFGDGATHYSTDVYCLKCRLYLCTGCFKHHRRLKEDWIRTHKNNLFTCKKCQAERNVFPVECLMLDPVMLLCAECFESGDINRRDVPEINDVGVKEAVNRDFIISRHCQLHKLPFQKNDENVTSTVYCLVCKTYMCKECFWNHRRLRNIMKPVAEEKSKDTQIGRGSLLPPMPKRHQTARKKSRKRICIVICGFIPIFGVLLNLAICRMDMKNVEPTSGNARNSPNGNHQRDIIQHERL